ncbi:unnamed protein product [Ectocarpus sp. 12 AP-2014]
MFRHRGSFMFRHRGCPVFRHRGSPMFRHRGSPLAESRRYVPFAYDATQWGGLTFPSRCYGGKTTHPGGVYVCTFFLLCLLTDGRTSPTVDRIYFLQRGRRTMQVQTEVSAGVLTASALLP